MSRQIASKFADLTANEQRALKARYEWEGGSSSNIPESEDLARIATQIKTSREG